MELKLGEIYRVADRTSRGLSFPTTAAAAIQYAHETGGIFYNATLSNLNGPVVATWSYDVDGQRVTQDRPIDPSAFDPLRSGIETFPVFRHAFSEQMDRSVDPAQYHIVTLTANRGGTVRPAIHLVPAGTVDADFAQWLEMLGRPDQPPTDRELASAARWLDEAVDELAERVISDARWNDQRDELGVEIFGLLLYGFALNASAYQMFLGPDELKAVVTRALARRVGLAPTWCTALVDAANRASRDSGHHPGHYELIRVGMAYYAHGRPPRWPAIIDHFFAQVSHVRDVAGGGPRK